MLSGSCTEDISSLSDMRSRQIQQQRCGSTRNSRLPFSRKEFRADFLLCPCGALLLSFS